MKNLRTVSLGLTFLTGIAEAHFQLFICFLLEEGGLGYLIYSPSLSDPASLKDSSFA
jgi:hypothetical protein